MQFVDETRGAGTLELCRERRDVAQSLLGELDVTVVDQRADRGPLGDEADHGRGGDPVIQAVEVLLDVSRSQPTVHECEMRG